MRYFARVLAALCMIAGIVQAKEMTATLYTELGDKNRAFEWLDTAFQEHDEELMGLKTDYALDPVRPDPRFAELVRKVGLPQ